MKSFGEQLREARKGKGMTQEVCARRSNLLVKTVERMESDNHDPSLSTLLKLTRELGKFEFEEGGKVIVIMQKGRVKE